MKIYIDCGHGGSDSGAVGCGQYEKNLNLDYGLKLGQMLQEYKNVEIKYCRTNDTNPSLRDRTNDSDNWGSNLYLSCHLNAFNGEARGTETIYSIYASDIFKKLCYDIGMSISNNLGIPFRRSFSKKGNNGDYYHVIRETNCEAIIIEALFIDNRNDMNKYNSDIIARSICNCLVDYYDLEAKEQPKPQPINENWLEILKAVSPYWKVWEKFVNEHQNEINLKGLIEKLYNR